MNQKTGTGGIMARGITVVALVSLVVAGSFIAFGLRPSGVASFYRDTLTPASFAIWSGGLIAATLAPPVIAIAFWIASKRFRYGWVLHFLLVPMTYAIVRGAIEMMLHVANEPDSDGPTGWATDPAALLMVICPIAYLVALGISRKATQRRVSGSSS